MAILTSDLNPKIKYDTSTKKVYEVDDDGNKVNGSERDVPANLQTLTEDRQSWTPEDSNSPTPIAQISSQSNNVASVGSDGKIYVSAVSGPTGATGATGPTGPVSVSTDAGNSATLGTDGKVYVATPSSSGTGKSYLTLGGIGVLQQKTYGAVLPVNENTSISSMSIACGTSGSANITFQLKKIPNGSNTAQNLGSAQTLTANNTYQSFSFSPSLSLVPGDRVQVEVTTSLTNVTPPTRVTISLVTTVG